MKKISSLLKDALVKKGYACPSTSHILPMTIGDSGDTVLKADFLQRKGFYALPVRPPTVPEGTSRIRFSLTADITEEEIKSLIELICCLLYTSPSPRDRQKSRMPSSA